MTTGLLIAGLGIALFVLTLKDRVLALAFFCALLPTYVVRFAIPLPVLDIAVPGTLLEVLFVGLFLGWLIKGGTRSRTWTALRAWYPPLLLLFIGATVGVLISPDLRGALGLWRAYFVEPTLFFVMAADIMDGPRSRNTVLWAAAISLGLTGMFAVIQKMTGFGIPNPVWAAEATRRVTGIYGFPNAIGLFAAPLTVLAAGRAIGALDGPTVRKRFLSLPAAAAAVLGMFAIAFAVSQGAMIGVAAGLAALGLLLRRTRAVTLGAVILACAVVIFYGPANATVTRLASLRDDSGSVRRIVWKESLAMLDDHRVFGAGLDGYRATLVPYHQAAHIEIFMYPHSVLLNFWTETGLIGVAGFVWLIVLCLRELWPHLRRDDEWLPQALVAALVAVLVHGLVDVPFFKNDLAFELMLLFALVAGLRIHERPTPKSFTAETARATVPSR